MIASAVLVAVALLAVVPPLRALGTSARREREALPGWVDASLGEVAATARPGERIGVIVPPVDSEGSEMALWYAAQYALVPALVQPVMIRECVEPDAPRCRLDGAVRVVALLPRADWVRLAERRLGLESLAASGPVLLMRVRAQEPR